MDRYRLVGSIGFLFIYLLVLFPVQTIVCCVLILIAYLLLKSINSDTVNTYFSSDNGNRERRIRALTKAKMYLAPYKSIWKNLKLSNKKCSIRILSDGHTIIAKESTAPYRTFRVISIKQYTDADLWDMFCDIFNYNTTFEDLIRFCKIYEAEIKIEGGEYKLAQGQEYSVTVSNNNPSGVVHIDMPEQKTIEVKEKLDVNNASEVELTALPGVSIVMAKKLIKRRDELSGFKSVDDVCKFLKLRPHMENQLKNLICVNKIQGSNNINRYKERSIDL